MDLATRLQWLHRIEQAHDQLTAKAGLACRTACDTCCTCNVTMTTLEGYRIIRHLHRHADALGTPTLAKPACTKRFRPKITLNALAEQYARDAAPAEEENDPNWGKCPMLKDRMCSIYAVRPFGCRILVSTSRCGPKGFAQMDEWTLTVNQVLMQYIEHIDRDGWTGNMADVLNCMGPSTPNPTYDPQALQAEKHGLIPNAPLRVLGVPPAYRSRITSLLQQIFQGA